jgi:hypothetical protein
MIHQDPIKPTAMLFLEAIESFPWKYLLVEMIDIYLIRGGQFLGISQSLILPFIRLNNYNFKRFITNFKVRVYSVSASNH